MITPCKDDEDVIRTLGQTPTAFVDSGTSLPAFGSYRGPLPPIDLRASLADRALRRKKWVWLGIASDEIWISLAVVRMGYATNTFAFAFDPKSRAMLVDKTVIGPPRAARIADDPHASGVLAGFDSGKTHVSIERDHAECHVRGTLGADFELDVRLDESASPPPIAAIAKLSSGSAGSGSGSLTSATEKRVLTKVKGSATLGGRTFRLDHNTNAIGGYDYTHGLMPRHTQWRWAFALGRSTKGEPISFNVVDGFVGEAECAAWTSTAIHPLVSPKFEFDRAHPERPWKLTGEGIDLTFDVGAVHAQHTNLLVVRSHFLQPVGAFTGTLRIGDRDVELDSVLGVVEDQDVVW
jgi:hypothetical protein